MTTPQVTKCPDSHFRRVVYGLGPYIADYPEQCILASIVSDWCPRYAFNCLVMQRDLFFIIDAPEHQKILMAHLSLARTPIQPCLRDLWT